MGNRTSWNRKDLDVELIKDKYFNENLSASEIGKLLGVSHDTILKRFRELNITTRSQKDSMGSDRVKSKLSVSLKGKKRAPWVIEILKKSMAGIPKSEEHKRKIGLKSKGRKHSEDTKNRLSEFRVDYIKDHPEERQRLKLMRSKQIFPLKDSSIEVKIRDYLDELGVEYFQHKHMNIKHSYQCDFFIPELNLVIECDGVYWHKYPVGRDIDHVRSKELIQKGFNVLRLWEYDIRGMTLESFQLELVKVQEETEGLN